MPWHSQQRSKPLTQTKVSSVPYFALTLLIMAAKAGGSTGMCPPDLPCWGHAVADVSATAEDPPWLPGSLHPTDVPVHSGYVRI